MNSVERSQRSVRRFTPQSGRSHRHRQQSALRRL
jgi:hypothetical protein